MKRTFKKNQRGFIAITYALMIVTLIGFTGLAVDVGFLQFERRKAQVAADAAAMGALRELERGNDSTDQSNAALNDASLNGFTNTQNGTTITVANPNNDTSTIQVTVQRVVPTFFMQIFGQNAVTVGATSMARTSNTEGSIGACIFALDPSAGNTLVISGGSTVTSACGVVVNSSSNQAFVISGSTSELALANGAQIGVVGNWDISGGATVMNSTTNTSESPVNIQTFTDPLASLTAPTTPVTGGIQSSQTWNIDSGHMPALSQLNPGIYCNGISIQSTSGTLTFNPGLYVIAGGGLTISSNATVAGSGVTFYNTQTSSSNSWGCSANNYNAGPIMIQGGQNSVNFSAPTSSPVLFFEDRNLPHQLSNQITGGSTGTFEGALYFKNGNLTFSGKSSGTNGGYLVIVADTITISGTSNLSGDHTDLTNVYTLAPTTTGGGLVNK